MATNPDDGRWAVESGHDRDIRRMVCRSLQMEVPEVPGPQPPSWGEILSTASHIVEQRDLARAMVRKMVDSFGLSPSMRDETIEWLARECA